MALMRLVSSEWRKFRAVPTMWWLLLAMMAASVVATVLAFMLNDIRKVTPNQGHALGEALHTVGFASVLVMVAAIIGCAGEFRFGQADQTFLSTPKRGRVVAAKSVVYAFLGAIFGVLNASIVLGTAWIWLTIKGYGLPMHQSVLWLTLGGGVASAVLYAVFGIAVGAALRSQVLGIVLVLAVQQVLEASLFAASSSVGRWTASEAGDALRDFPQQGLLTMGTGAAILAAWAAGILSIGYIRTKRGDITT
jgi:ABC-2 type transport system permease protein